MIATDVSATMECIIMLLTHVIRYIQKRLKPDQLTIQSFSIEHKLVRTPLTSVLMKLSIERSWKQLKIMGSKHAKKERHVILKYLRITFASTNGMKLNLVNSM